MKYERKTKRKVCHKINIMEIIKTERKVNEKKHERYWLIWQGVAGWINFKKEVELEIDFIKLKDIVTEM